MGKTALGATTMSEAAMGMTTGMYLTIDACCCVPFHNRRCIGTNVEGVVRTKTQWIGAMEAMSMSRDDTRAAT